MQRETALQMLAVGLVGTASAAVARVWTLGPGDICDECPMRAECADQTECLHLVQSAGTSTRIDGSFRRFPLGAREVGKVPQTLEPVVRNEDVGQLGLADHTWLMVHDVRAFAAVPLAFEGQCIGVAAVFARDPMTDERLAALEALASLAAAAIASKTAVAAPAPRAARPVPPAPSPGKKPDAPGVEFLRPFDATEKDVLERVLEHTHGRLSGPRGAAALLDLKPTTLHSRMKKLGVTRRARKS